MAAPCPVAAYQSTSLAGDAAPRRGDPGAVAATRRQRMGAGSAAERRVAATVGGHSATWLRGRTGDVRGLGPLPHKAGKGRADAALAGVVRPVGRRRPGPAGRTVDRELDRRG